ncbi:MAG: glycosyltransferase [Verrucomicrobia bacterium]|nr:glycosyltransferase [Verrucomicrobiota bacterium]
MIPRIIHQPWKTRNLPPLMREFQESWFKHHPEWEYRLWTNEDNKRLIHEQYPQYAEVFRRFTPPIVKIDFIRLAYMHRFGGLYTDMDFEALRPIDLLLADGRIAVGRENGGIGIPMCGRPFIINAFIASPAGHPLWLEIMQAMADRFRLRQRFEPHAFHVIRMTIEIFDELVGAYAQDHDDITIHSFAPFYPAPPSVRFRDERRELAGKLNSYAIHHYANTWVGWHIRLINAVEIVKQLWKRSRRSRNGSP